MGSDASLPRQVDVVVLGGGPAGCAAAIALRQNGLQVLVVERLRSPRPDGWASLPPKAQSLLALLGLLRAVERADFVRMRGLHICSSGRSVAEAFDPVGQSLGYQLERRLFDELLVARVRALGGQFVDDCEVVGVLGDPPGVVEGVLLRCAPTDAPTEVEARFVIDASGRSRVLGTNLALGWSSGPKTKVLSGAWVLSFADDRGADTDTCLEILPGGWVSSSIHRGPTRNVSVGVDDDALVGRGLTQRLDVYQTMIGDSTLIAELIHSGRLIGPVTMRDATVGAADRFVGSGFVLAGDAAFVTEAILFDGIHRALHSGIVAAAVANTAVRSPGDAQMALSYYDSAQRVSAGVYATRDQAWFDAYRAVGPFWAERGRPLASDKSRALATKGARVVGAGVEPDTDVLAFAERLRRREPDRVRLTLTESGRVEVGAGPRRGMIAPISRFVVRGIEFETGDVEMQHLAPLLDGRPLVAVFEAYAASIGVPDTELLRAAQISVLAGLLALDVVEIVEES
ncbi:MAG: tryptophan 7-halogenase [Deltaproteobacteria bacterium]|nr:tryptophan 7-halogenase [Deltaproteobacteria bacterium]